MAHSVEIVNELNNLSALVASLPPESPYQVPAGYFGSLAGIMMTRLETIEEEKMVSFLSDINRGTWESAPPAGYFDELPALILKRIKLEAAISQDEELEILSPLLRKLSKNAPFELPEGYFNDLPSDVIAGVNAVDYVNQELESSEPMLNNYKIKNAYHVPDGYFEHLESSLLDNVKGKQKSSVIAFSFNRSVLRYSVAALVAGVLSMAAWIFFQNKPSVTSGTDPLANIEQISNDEMISYLETTLAEGDIVSTATYPLKDEDVRDILFDLPDEELQQYLEHNAILKDLTIN